MAKQSMLKVHENLHIIQLNKELYSALNKNVGGISITILNDYELELLSYIECNGPVCITEIVEQVKNKIPVEWIEEIINNFIEKKLIHQDDGSEILPVEVSPSSSINILYELTNKCNFNCSYCYQRKLDYKPTIKESKSYIDKLINILNYQKNNRTIEHVNLTISGGEPLIEYDLLKELIPYTVNLFNVNNYSFSLKINSNASLLDEEKIIFLKNYINQIQISIDGVEEGHNLSRHFINGKGSYKDVMKNIELLQKYQFPLECNIMLTPQNLDSIPELIKIFSNKNIDYFLSIPVETQFTHKEMLFESVVSNKAELLSILEKLETIYNTVIQYSPQKSILDNNGFLDLSVSKIKSCNSTGSSINIKPNGNINACSLYESHLSNIKTDDIQDKVFTDPLNLGCFTTSKKTCNECEWIYMCGGLCSGGTLFKYGTVKAAHPLCNFIKDLIPLIIKKESEKLLYDNYAEAVL